MNNIYVDIDETICKTPPDRDYSKAEPLYNNISKINALYDAGHNITYWTARGTGSGKDWLGLTKQQFDDWGVKYHDLQFGKPAYDVLIDDKAVNAYEWMKRGSNDISLE